MLVVGVVAGVVGFALFIAVGLSGILGAVAHQAPVTLTVQCQVGDYYVYQDTGTRQSAGGTSVTTSGEVTMTTADVRVTGPDGNRVATFTGSGAETITIGSAQYADAVGFHASTSGAYLVRIAAVTPSSVVVAPSVGSQFLRAAPWLALAGVGGLLVVGGVAWLVIAIVRRRRTDRPDPWGGPAPPLPPGAVPPGPWLPRNYDPFPAPPPAPPAPPPPSAAGS
jgi:hypothetical protein